MIYRNALLLICWALVYGQPPPAPPGIDVGTLTDQARRFVESMFFFFVFFFFALSIKLLAATDGSVMPFHIATPLTLHLSKSVDGRISGTPGDSFFTVISGYQ